VAQTGRGHPGRPAQREGGTPPAGQCPDATDLLFTITSFETFDVLAGAGKTPEALVPLVQHLARAVVALC
jgi:hypothetical protein